MSTDLETDLRREFDAVRPPSSLTFSPDSVARAGRRTILRRRIIGAGSTTMAIALVAGGAALLTSPDNSATPPPASRTATSGIVLAKTGHMWGGQSEVRFNRDPAVTSNVRFSVLGKDGRRHELGVASTGKPGQKPTAVWKSAMVDGHPVTIGLFPGDASDPPSITFADGMSYGIGSEELKGTGYTVFYIDYSAVAGQREPARPSTIASIRWNDYGIVQGIEGDHRLSGRVFTINENMTVDVVLRPTEGGRTTVYGQANAQDGGSRVGFPLSAATTNPSGVAVATGRTPVLRRTAKGPLMSAAGPPLAAGILPPGVSDIGVILSTNDAVAGTAVSNPMPDGSVIFVITGNISRSPDPGMDTIKAVTWTNADGSQGRIAVTQKRG